jgi:hypothetical protein
VLAAAIWIQTRLEANIGAVVTRNDCLRAISKELRRAPWPLAFIRIDIDKIDIGKIDMEFFKPVRRTPGSASTVDCRRRWWRLFDDGHELTLCHRMMFT